MHCTGKTVLRASLKAKWSELGIYERNIPIDAGSTTLYIAKRELDIITSS